MSDAVFDSDSPKISSANTSILIEQPWQMCLSLSGPARLPAGRGPLSQAVYLLEACRDMHGIEGSSYLSVDCKAQTQTDTDTQI